MSRSTIYLILNKQNGHKFIGNTTIGMNKEWVYHIERSKRMSSEPLHKAFREYGVHNFMIKELDECDEKEVETKTTYWIEKYTPEYNPIIVIEKPIEKPIVIKEPVKKERPKRPKPDYLVPWNENTRGDGKKLGFKIRGKNLETGLCTDYESARVAAEAVTGNAVNNSNILLAAKTGRTAYGHKWQILESREKKTAVFGVNKKTEQIDVRYESVAAAVRSFECSDRKGILNSLHNPGRYSWKGRYWFYAR